MEQNDLLGQLTQLSENAVEAIQANGVATGAGAGGTAAANGTAGTAAGLNSAATATNTASITYQSDIASLKVRLGFNVINILREVFQQIPSI